MNWVFRGVKVEVVLCGVGVQNVIRSGFRSLLLSLTTALLRGYLCWGCGVGKTEAKRRSPLEREPVGKRARSRHREASCHSCLVSRQVR